jgi:septal ring factor EnvC (AmiA/AmiB activator)
MDNENKENQVPENNVSAADELTAIKAQLEEVQTANATLKEATVAKDTRVAELEAQVAEFSGHLENKTKELEAAAAELATTREARGHAVAKYLGQAKALNPTIPEGIIAGESVEEIDQSVEKGKAIVAAVRKALLSEEKELAAATKVPAGAPTRGEISLEGLSPREKIAAGIQQKGGS